jgi:hypothetical protein
MPAYLCADLSRATVVLPEFALVLGQTYSATCVKAQIFLR